MDRCRHNMEDAVTRVFTGTCSGSGCREYGTANGGEGGTCNRHPPSRNNRLVSMTPLIDVVFILLLFFMLVSNFQQWRGMPLNLAGQQNNPEQQSRLIGVQIGRYGS